ncbi:MAG: glycosyltransferase [Candidatus Binataceae bacterium]
MAETLRVLYVASGIAPRYGGVFKDIPGLCGEMGRRGWDVTLFVTDADGPGHLDVPIDTWVDRDSFRLRYFRATWLPGRFNTFGFSEAYRRALRTAIPDSDAVHIYSLYNYPSLCAAYYARRSRIPYVLEPHGTLDAFVFTHHKWRKRLYEQLLERRNLRNAAAVRFLSEAEASIAARILDFKLNGVVIPTGIDSHDLKPVAPVSGILDKYHVPRGRRIILFVGRLHKKKGVDLLARAFVQVAQDDQDIHLVVVGPDEGMEQQVKDIIGQATLHGRATFTGMIIGQDKIDLMSAATMVVVPSYAENFCNVVLESIATGVPLVVSNGVAIAKQIEDAGAGIVTAPATADLAAAIKRLLHDPQLALSMSQAGKLLAERSFSWNSVGAQVDSLYRRIIAERPQAMNGSCPSCMTPFSS